MIGARLTIKQAGLTMWTHGGVIIAIFCQPAVRPSK
jgi:hypothetical protein